MYFWMPYTATKMNLLFDETENVSNSLFEFSDLV